MKLRVSKTQKPKLSQTLRSWLPILQADLQSLEDVLKKYKDENPFLEIISGFEKRDQKIIESFYTKRSVHSQIEALNIYEKNLEEVLFEQISPPLFPTSKSQKIAYKIIENLNEEGYFIGDLKKISKELEVLPEDIERVRKRFAHLEPPGIGAVDFKEAFLFQLEDFDLEDEVYKKACKIIDNFENINSLRKDENFKKALEIIKKLKHPPAIEYIQNEGLKEKIPDIFIDFTKDGIEVRLNEDFYPTVVIDTKGLKEDKFVKEKIKEAKGLINALSMRKETLYKVALMIIEYQYDFFTGGEKKPMKLSDLAKELGYNASTISRAISNKYLSCNRGVVSLKSFFTTAIDDDVSNDSVKNLIIEIVKNEDKRKPLSDSKILAIIEEKLKIKLGRRTVAKYRKQLNIAGSSERKKIYSLSLESV